MRLFAVRGVSILGFILLVGWELWKAMSVIEYDEEVEEPRKKVARYYDNLELINEHLLTTHPEDVEYAAIQRVRKQMMLASCGKRKRTDFFPKGTSPKVGINAGAFKNILVSDKHQLLYCVTPKVACTNWKRVLLVMEGLFNTTSDIPYHAVHNNSVGYLKRLSDYSPREITFRLSSYYKFLFVRHPFERLVSAYRNKFVEAKYFLFKKTYGKYIMRKYRSKENRTLSPDYHKGEGLTFEEFVRFISDSPLDAQDFWNEHWERIDRLCHPCLMTYDFVGKLETMGQDSDYLLRTLELSDKVKFPTKDHRPTRMLTKDLVYDYFSKLPQDQVDKLYKLYQHDFDMFNYKVPDFQDQHEDTIPPTAVGGGEEKKK